MYYGDHDEYNQQTWAGNHDEYNVLYVSTGCSFSCCQEIFQLQRKQYQKQKSILLKVIVIILQQQRPYSTHSE